MARTIRDLADRLSGAVVSIGRDWGRGSGVVIDEGWVVTNAHNLRGEEVTVVFSGGRVEQGRVAGVDVDGDLGVVAVDTRDAAAASWPSEGPEVALGTPVFALANPGGRSVRVTYGLVSSLGQAFRGPSGRRIIDAIEHTAPLARGSSGGPLLNADGRLLGINTHRRGEGFYLAVPTTSELRRRVEGLTRGERPRRPRLGIAVAPPEVASRLRHAVGLPERQGLLVRWVDDNAPAARAGLRTGDLLVAADDTPVRSSDDLFAVLDQLQEEASLPLRIVRGSDELSVAVTFGETREEGAV
ncbi:MAG: S1C family serine protease [Actinomycetota bacterium]|nr:S1C family serine protease [Actinomycetota bacterium]